MMKNKITSQQKLEYQYAYRRKLKEQGLCLYCRCVLKGDDKKYARCSTCRSKVVKARLDKIHKLREQGLCICGKPITVRAKSGVCEDCWFRDIAKCRTGSPKNWLVIKELLQRQNYCCVYTGKELVMGENASLDHINPKSKGGDNSVSNLQWVDLQINVMKNNMSHKEFISTINLILSRQTAQELTYGIAQSVS